MTPKWTPGPWSVMDGDNCGGTARKTASWIHGPLSPSEINPGMEEYCILAEVWGPPPVPADERKANARLITAAPDLYAALEALLSASCDDQAYGASVQELADAPAVANALAALRKARGEAA